MELVFADSGENPQSIVTSDSLRHQEEGKINK